MAAPPQLLYVGIVRNDDPSHVVAAASYDSHALGKRAVSGIEEAIRNELGKNPNSSRAEHPALGAYVSLSPMDLTDKGGRRWVVAVCATAQYTPNYAEQCGREVVTAIVDAMEHQQDLEEWAAAPGRKGGSAHGLTKKFNWIDRVRMGWAGKTQLALLQADTERVKDVIGDNIMLELGNLESADQLDEKARELQNAGKQFQAGARQAKRNECIKDCKLKIMIGGVVLLVVIIIIIAVS